MLSGTDDILNGAIKMPASGKNNRSLVIKDKCVFPYILGFLKTFCNSAAPQRPADGTVPSPVATYLATTSLSWAREEPT